ncbi:MAG: Short-chain dehydrogenase/reductase, partial [Myxococcaceae bacterium]|nr:Short-chain dehydrogenase/reductase [Myxococcaceae bacterium]
LAKLVLADMVAQGYGRVLFVSSVDAITPTPFEAVYGASKAFILSFSSSLHNELQGTGVSVTALMPGPTETNIFHRAHMENTWVGSQGLHENYASQVALQGYRALMAGRERVVAATLKTKLMAALARFVPESVKAALHRKVSEPGTAERSLS